MSQHSASPEFERKMQEIGAKSAHMVIPRSKTQQPVTECRYPAWTEDEENTMSTERDELFALICGRTTLKAVDRVLAAGYRKPRQVTTVEELDALPDSSVILEVDGTPTKCVKRLDGKNWWVDGPRGMSSSELVPLPVTVLHVGGAE